jgi:hypothetical protein
MASALLQPAARLLAARRWALPAGLDGACATRCHYIMDRP